MFRHALIHNDQLQHAVYQEQSVSWGLSLTLGTGHIIGKNHIHIDVKTLYQDLLHYLREVEAENDPTLIKVTVGFKYTTPPVKIAEELSWLDRV
jgi:hypothetical protein